MKSERVYNKKNNEVYIKNNIDGSVDIISDNWDKFKEVQDRMYEAGFYLSEVEEWDEGDDMKIITKFTEDDHILN
jgi:hypothetical protein